MTRLVDWEDWASGRRVVGFHAGELRGAELQSYGKATAGATTPWSWAALPGVFCDRGCRGPHHYYTSESLAGPDPWRPWLTSERRPEPAHGGKR